jgi:4-hydroxybenzoate polyprenyltransferase
MDWATQVERTRSRPLAAGTITPLAALVFLGAQLSASLAILLQLNTYTQVRAEITWGAIGTS